MVTLTMAGVIVRRDGRMLTVLGTEERDGETLLHIQGAAVDLWATPRELYQKGYRLVAAKPAIWDLWGRGVYGYGSAQLILCQEPARPDPAMCPISRPGHHVGHRPRRVRGSALNP